MSMAGTPKRFAVIDLAAASPVRARVSKLAPPEGAFLLDRTEFPDLIAYGPWLIDLDACQAVESAWIKAGKWKSWGFIIHSGLSLSALKLHFRKFNLVRLEGRSAPLLFRYFDPVVLLAFLMNVATAEQRNAFMAPIDLIELEDINNRDIVKIHRDKPYSA